MRIAVLGGGPAGLYFAASWRRRHPDAEVVLYEQNAATATFGFGVVFSDRALEFLRHDDPDTADAIGAHMETWSDMTLVHRGERVTIDGVGFSAIGRLTLLGLLRERAVAAGAELRFETRLASLDALAGYDLVVAADGINSLARRAYEGDFATSLSYHDQKFAWFGTPRRFETLTQTFVETQWGAFNAHHYRYAPDMSTFIVECGRETWLKAGFDTLSPDASRARCADIFADTLAGAPLVANASTWRNFPWIWNERWSVGKVVLVGDALHTAHYSIGSGTRLALEDVLALVKALEAAPGDIPAALAAYESGRKAVVRKLVDASKASAAWYADFETHMRRAPVDFTHAYITRSGRIDPDRLRAMAPRFMARYEAHADAA
jgi:2-polyprenyl-6-methoxyphenol hydroxylase-like FAD-dependent oxidoreductase